MPRQITYGFGGANTDGGLEPTYGFMSGSGPAPPAGGGNIFITGHRRRKAAKLGSNMIWKGALWLFCLGLFSLR